MCMISLEQFFPPSKSNLLLYYCSPLQTFPKQYPMVIVLSPSNVLPLLNSLIPSFKLSQTDHKSCTQLPIPLYLD